MASEKKMCQIAEYAECLTHWSYFVKILEALGGSC